MPWRTLSTDPNSEAAVGARRAVLDAARADESLERREIIRRYCADRLVLDIGCVDHDAATAERPDWLHRFVAEAAGECVGVDIEATGVEQMRQLGYDVVLHDITTGAGPLAERGPFDTVVAGELIEHLDSPRALFDVARDVLRPGGHLIITTPNPYGRVRVRAGQLGITWENVDHVTYIAPSGVVEMAERTGGLRLVLYGSEAITMKPPTARGVVAAGLAWLRRRPVYLQQIWPSTVIEWIVDKVRSPLLRGETMTYVLQRTD